MEKSDVARLRWSPEEKEAFQKAADLSGMSLSAWMRVVLRKVAAHELDQAGTPVPFRHTAFVLANA